MSGVWDDLKRNVTALSTAAAESTGRLARRGVLALDLVELRRSCAREYEHLGKRVRVLLDMSQAAAIAADADVRSCLDRVTSLESAIARTEAAMAELHHPPAHAANPSEAATEPPAAASNTRA